MTSLKQIEANRLNALKSTGPKTAAGKRRARCNALRHGLTAEIVIGHLESSADFKTFAANISADYAPVTATQRELVMRLASVLWRLRRANRIETGLFQIQAELMTSTTANRIGRARPPKWYDELDTGTHVVADIDAAEAAAFCFVQLSRLQYGTFDLLKRYETALWHQAAHLIQMLKPLACKNEP
jgi:hypothetical protein